MIEPQQGREGERYQLKVTVKEFDILFLNKYVIHSATAHKWHPET